MNKPYKEGNRPLQNRGKSTLQKNLNHQLSDIVDEIAISQGQAIRVPGVREMAGNHGLRMASGKAWWLQTGRKSEEPQMNENQSMNPAFILLAC